MHPVGTLRRVCVVGLDGVPIGLLRDLAARGVMPRTAELVARGHLAQMRVTLPEISAVSWTSFMTGANPGAHGIFGFTDLAPNSYRLVFPGYPDVKVPTLWDRLGSAGRVSVVINQPATYPARPLRGVLVSGFVAPELRRSVYPARYLRDLESQGYMIDVDTLRGREDHDFLLADLGRALAGRRRAFDWFWEREDWHYYEVVVTGTDRLQHFLWHALQDPAHPLHARCLDYYRQVDAFVGHAADAMARKTGRALEGFYMLSDHGFCAIRQEFQLNAWLAGAGYLRFGSPRPESLEEIHPATRAFALDPGRIYIHRRGRFPRGQVDDVEARVLAAEITARLAELRFEGDAVVERVIPAGEIYSGPEAATGPDLVVLTRRGFDVKAKVAARTIFGRTVLTGMHTWDDAFFWSAEPIGRDLEITALAPELLSRLGVQHDSAPLPRRAPADRI